MRLRRLFFILASLGLMASVAVGTLIAVVWQDLPAISEVQDIRLKEPLRIYSIDGKLLGEFGDERRITVRFEDTPGQLIDAILAAEDDRFFSHHGIDLLGVARAIVANLRSMDTRQGASTITMQVARNYFLSREKTYSRKIKEALLAFRLERELSKEQILELYLNKIFLGHRSYGFQAASFFYYDKPLASLNLAQLAMLAGLPKAPSSINPVSNPDRASKRRDYVLGRMRELKRISEVDYEAARSAPITAQRHGMDIELNAPYLAEMVRDYMVARFGEEVYASGYRVYTTVPAKNQKAANQALKTGLVAYDRRHGYRGPAGYINPVDFATESQRLGSLANYPSAAGSRPAMVIRPGGDAIDLFTSDGKFRSISPAGWRWTGKSPSSFLHPGDVIYYSGSGSDLALSQIPEIQGALVSLDPTDASVLALVGGLDFKASRFNRVVQAERQPGSNIKPFIYSAAIANGFTASTLVSGAPIVVEDDVGGAWRPQNYSKQVFGPTRLREALSISLNLVSVRLVRALGIETVRDYLSTFGFEPSRLPKGLSLALGSATVTPMEIVRGYAAFANGGYLIEPYFIARIEDQSGGIIEYANRVMLCPDCPAPSNDPQARPQKTIDLRFAKRIISAENAFIVDSLMQEVVRSGTARAAAKLDRDDLAGKTGTTNNYFDAWFTGYNPDVVTSVWVGFDSPKDLGEGESGARAALPIWIDFMSTALGSSTKTPRPIPDNIISVRVNRDSGLRAREDDPKSYLEYFVRGSEPPFPDPGSTIDPIQGLF